MWGSMHSDFRGAAKKLERETRERTQRAKVKGAREQAEKERVKQKIVAIEEEQRQRRLADLAAQEEERLRHEEAVEENNGVWWSSVLRATPVSSDLAKRIKRSADKISLPPSAESELTRQDASKNGAQLFELACGGRHTHAGLLDFTAVEGTVGVPDGMARILWGPGTLASGQDVNVTYRKLHRGTFVRFQPQSASFQQEVGAEVEFALEQALLTRSTLTEGDWVTVSHADQQYDLCVQELRPAGQVSVIDTDMEADVGTSLETENRVTAELEAAREREAQLAALAAAAKQEAQQREDFARLESQRLHALQQEKAAALPPEPEPSTSQPLTTCAVRLPDGSRLMRRFLPSTPLQMLFDYIDAYNTADIASGSYQLVSSYPRKAVSGPLNTSLQEAGFGSGQHVFLLEQHKA